MGLSIAEVFSSSTRHVKQSVREKIFSENHLQSVHHTIAFAILGAFLWGADWSADPEHAEKALLFRLGCLAVLLLSALIKWLSKSVYINYLAAYLSLALCQAGFVMLLAGLNAGGLVQLSGALNQGVGQFIYFFLGTVLFCTHFPIISNFVGCVGLALMPHVFGAALTEGFPHVLFASVLWPAGALTLLVHWKIRMLLVEKQKLQRDIELSVITDPVTGLLNVRGLHKAFQRISKLAKTKPVQQFLILTTIDGFETIKATHGQGFANSLLGKIGEMIEISFRGRDIAASLSDSEFAVILPNISSKEKAFELAERLRTIIQDTTFDCLTSETGKLSCTACIAIVSVDTNEDFKTVLNRARVGIDHARSQGTNRCVFI